MCLVDRVRNQRDGFQFFINGMVVQDRNEPKRSRDKNEFDVVELVVDDEENNDVVECWIYACSISSSYRNDNTEQLSKLADEANREFPNMRIRTRYMIPDSEHDSLRIDDAGRNYN